MGSVAFRANGACHSQFKRAEWGKDFTRIDFVRLLKAQTRRGQCELRVCECVCVQLCVCVRQVQVQSRVLCKQMKSERESDENQKLRRFDGGCKKIKLATAQSARLSSPFHYATLALSLSIPPFLYVTLYVTPSLCVSPLQVTIFVAYIRACFIIFYHLLGKLCSRKTTTTNNNNWLLLLMQNVFQLNVPTPPPVRLASS